MSLGLKFTEEQLEKFDNAVDLVYSKGFTEEVKFQDAKEIGTSLITYYVMRSSELGDVMVQMTYNGANGCQIQFFKPSVDGRIEISFKEILAMKTVND